jgi:hypothetical protein
MNVVQVLKQIEDFSSKLPEGTTIDVGLNGVDDNEIINYGSNKENYYAAPTMDMNYHWCVIEKKNIRVVLRGKKSN